MKPTLTSPSIRVPPPETWYARALELERLAQSLVQHAVVAERERDPAWEQIAGAAGTTRQSPTNAAPPT